MIILFFLWENISSYIFSSTIPYSFWLYIHSHYHSEIELRSLAPFSPTHLYNKLPVCTHCSVLGISFQRCMTTPRGKGAPGFPTVNNNGPTSTTNWFPNLSDKGEISVHGEDGLWVMDTFRSHSSAFSLRSLSGFATIPGLSGHTDGLICSEGP